MSRPRGEYVAQKMWHQSLWFRTFWFAHLAACKWMCGIKTVTKARIWWDGRSFDRKSLGTRVVNIVALDGRGLFQVSERKERCVWQRLQSLTNENQSVRGLAGQENGEEGERFTQKIHGIIFPPSSAAICSSNALEKSNRTGIEPALE